MIIINILECVNDNIQISHQKNVTIANYDKFIQLKRWRIVSLSSFSLFQMKIRHDNTTE